MAGEAVGDRSVESDDDVMAFSKLRGSGDGTRWMDLAASHECVAINWDFASSRLAFPFNHDQTKRNSVNRRVCALLQQTGDTKAVLTTM